MSKARQQAQEIANLCAEYGWTFSVRGSILEINKVFTPGSLDEFVTADMEYYSILSLLPSTSAGSIWGTDGGGIGAIGATQRGLFTMKKSGGSKRVLNALKALTC